MKFKFIKNPIKSPYFGKQYGQNVEPSGYYVNKFNGFVPEGWISGIAELKNPLIILINNETIVSWKFELSKKYKKKGRELTIHLQQIGYDGIITKYENGDIGEIIIFEPKMSIMNELPFTEEITEGYNVRTFLSTLDESELKWHFDEEDRIIVCEHDTDWQIQMDDELPIRIEKNKKYFIPEGEYHRVIKGNGDLIVKVKKLKEQIISPLPKLPTDATYVSKKQFPNIKLPSSSKISFKDIVRLTIDNLEGGYYNPTNTVKKDMRDSGETMFGMDRKHGSNFTNSQSGKLFWSLIDKDKKKNPKKWVRYYKLDDNQSLKSKLIDIITNNWLIPNYNTLTTKYLTKEVKNFVDNDNILKYHLSYAVWNGEGWFRRFSKIINNAISRGIQNNTDLHKIAINSRINSGNIYIKKSGQKIKDTISTKLN